eukprot:UN05240
MVKTTSKSTTLQTANQKVKKSVQKSRTNPFNQVSELALAKLYRIGKRKYNAVFRVFREATAAVLSTATSQRRASTFIRGRSVEDRRSKDFNELVPCPFELGNRHFAVWANNRLTVYLDQSFDNQLRPAYTFFNIANIPLKSEVDIYANYVVKKWCITACTWLGNNEEVQIVIGDASGNLYRCDLQQRTCVNTWRAFDDESIGVKSMKTQTKSNVFAVLGTNNIVKFYASKDLYESQAPVFIGSSEVKPEIIDMFWDDNRLLCLTADEIIEIKISTTAKSVTKLTKKPNTDMKWKMFYTPKKAKGTKFLRMKVYGLDCVLLQKSKGGIEEHNLVNKKFIRGVDVPEIKAECSFDLHPNKNIIAVGGSDGDLNLLNYPSGDVHTYLKKKEILEVCVKECIGIQL